MVALLLTVITVGCVEDEYGYPPVYGEVYCVEQEPMAGDSVTLRVKIEKPGNGAYRAEYSWKINGTTVKKETVIDPFATAPELKYKFAQPGSYNVSMTATFRMSMPMASGQIASNAASKVGKVRIK